MSVSSSSSFLSSDLISLSLSHACRQENRIVLFPLSLHGASIYDQSYLAVFQPDGAEILVSRKRLDRGRRCVLYLIGVVKRE